MASGYGTAEGAAEYHAERGNTAWAGISEEGDLIARLRGSEFIDRKFRARFYGSKTDGRTQEREWPRIEAYDKAGLAYDTDEIPDEVVYASYEAALREYASPGSLEPDVTLSDGVKSESVYQAVSVEYTGARDETDYYPILAVVNRILEPVLMASSSSLSGRAVRS